MANMETGVRLLLLGIVFSTSCAIDVLPIKNPLPKVDKSLQKITKPLANVGEQARQRVFGDMVERTFTDYYFGGHKYASVVTDNTTGEVLDCMVIGDREFIAYMVGDQCSKWSGPVLELVSDQPSIQFINVTTDLMDDYIAQCDGRKERNDTRPLFQKFMSGLKKGPKTILKHAVIFPGTKWCGAGNVARNYDDLGQMSGTDKCCRDHDHAVESLDRGEEKHGLKNDLLYTMTKCTDDETFNKCLFNDGSAHAGAVGTTYFNVLKTKCFDKRKKAKCTSKLVSGITPCTEYKYDENSPETWQVFDASAFVPNSSLPVQKLNEYLHSAPGLGDLLSVVA
ncbi:uncharacterized protein LOC100898289 [Galendromus occidentalis]|uniref:Phospholipase A2 n=1 Tax=Galendromus occidentalis TaxID=34638 RepID=A0AAJ6QXV0_9ACAR|nr:uncharacterized protein LOC100898289 [Galendromus occidentalis]